MLTFVLAVLKSSHSTLVVGHWLLSGLDLGQERLLWWFILRRGSEMWVFQQVHHCWFCVGINVFQVTLFCQWFHLYSWADFLSVPVALSWQCIEHIWEVRGVVFSWGTHLTMFHLLVVCQQILFGILINQFSHQVIFIQLNIHFPQFLENPFTAINQVISTVQENFEEQDPLFLDWEFLVVGGLNFLFEFGRLLLKVRDRLFHDEKLLF